MQTSNDNLDEIITDLRRFHDKNNEMSKKKFALDNEVDLLLHQIDKDREVLVQTMSKAGQANEELTTNVEMKKKREEIKDRTSKE